MRWQDVLQNKKTLPIIRKGSVVLIKYDLFNLLFHVFYVFASFRVVFVDFHFFRFCTRIFFRNIKVSRTVSRF